MPWVPCVLARLVCLVLDQQMPVPSSQSVVWTAPARARRRPVRMPPASSGVAFARERRCSRRGIAIGITRKLLRALAVVRILASPAERPGAGMACLPAGARGTPEVGTA